MFQKTHMMQKENFSWRNRFVFGVQWINQPHGLCLGKYHGTGSMSY